MTAELRNGDVLKVFHALAEKWQMSSEEQATLLGDCSRGILCSFEKYRSEGLQWLGSSHSAVGRYTESRRGYCSHRTPSKNFITRPNASAPLNGISIREYLAIKKYGCRHCDLGSPDAEKQLIYGLKKVWRVK